MTTTALATTTAKTTIKAMAKTTAARTTPQQNQLTVKKSLYWSV